MLTRSRSSRSINESGFTLIELLVVIIIIGILAAIAIPVFLSQRQKGYDASVKSDLRNAATAEETYLTESLTSYSMSSLTPSGLKITPNNTITVGINLASAYCLIGINSNSSNYFLYDSSDGGLKLAKYTTLTAAQNSCSFMPTAWNAAT
jgi:type IV pilus assembly protein PilA